MGGTVYHIGSAPLKREGIIDSCLLVLHDWSHYLLLEDAEIDKERGVIHEEWRTRRAGMAVQRLMEQAMPKIYKGTKYEDCMPIGSMDIVDNFPYQDLRDYYHKWYRPDLQAIIVVGDFDVDKMEKKIKKTFSSIPMPKMAAERIYYPVNDNDTMIVAIEKDKEQPIALCHLYQKRDATPDNEKNTEKYLRDDYVDGLISTMLNDRYMELRQQPDAPFQSATGRSSMFFLSRTKDAFSMSVSCKSDNILGGIIATVGVAERARQHGFTQSELDRAKKLRLNAAERRSKMKDDYRNSHYVNDCVDNFLEGEPLVSVDFLLENTRKLDHEVTLAEVNAAVKELITDQSINGSSSIKDMKTMFQLAYLYFTQPRRDSSAYASLVSRTRSFLSNRNASPKVDYNDSIRAILYGHHPRLEAVVKETLDKASYDRIFQIYKERFSDASNFKTVIIGNYDEQELRSLICQYLATLPATGRHEQTNYQNVPRIVDGEKVVKFSKQQATPLANVSIFLTADVPFTPQSDLELDFLKRCLSIAYTDSVREEKGGTYGVSVDFELEKDDQPNTTLSISYNADPSRYEELNPIIYQQLKNIADHGPSATSMQKVKEYLVKQYAQAAITNDYWSYIIWHELDDQADFDRDYCKMVQEMKPENIQQMAQQLLAAKRCIEVTMLSE